MLLKNLEPGQYFVPLNSLPGMNLLQPTPQLRIFQKLAGMGDKIPQPSEGMCYASSDGALLEIYAGTAVAICSV